MNAPASFSRKASLFRSNRSQAVRIPKDLEFPDSVEKVYVRRDGRSLVLVPVNEFWDDFFSKPGIDIEEPAELSYGPSDTF